MNDVLSWIEGDADAAAALLADRAVASRALGGAVAPGEIPAWVAELGEKVAGLEDMWNQVKGWGQGQVKGMVTDATAPAVRAGSNALTGGLLGAGVGALGGMAANALSSNPRKKPLRNALFGGLMGGLGGAVIGGAGTHFGAFGGKPPGGDARVPGGPLGPPATRTELDQWLATQHARFNSRNDPTLDKTYEGFKDIPEQQLYRGIGQGAAAGVGANLGVRGAGTLGRAALNTSRARLNHEQLRAMLPTTQMNHIGSLLPADMAKLQAGDVTPITGQTDAIRKALLGSKNPAANALAGQGNAAMAKALGGGGTSKWTTDWSKGPSLIEGNGRWGLRGGLLGGAYTGIQRGMDKEREALFGSDPNSNYWTSTVNGIQQRYAGALAKSPEMKAELEGLMAKIKAAPGGAHDPSAAAHGAALQDLQRRLRDAEVLKKTGAFDYEKAKAWLAEKVPDAQNRAALVGGAAGAGAMGLLGATTAGRGKRLKGLLGGAALGGLGGAAVGYGMSRPVGAPKAPDKPAATAPNVLKPDELARPVTKPPEPTPANLIPTPGEAATAIAPSRGRAVVTGAGALFGAGTGAGMKGIVGSYGRKLPGRPILGGGLAGAGVANLLYELNK